MRDVLTTFIQDQTGAAAEVHDLERIPGGFSYETWRFRGVWTDEVGRHDERLIMRRAPRGGVLEPYDASKEFRVLRALEDTPVPVPRAYWVEPTGSVLGTSFYVMELVDGTVPIPWDESIDSDTRAEMHRHFVDVLAALHRVDWETRGLGFLGIPADRSDPAALELERCRELLGRVALRPYPILREIIATLDERRPRTPQLVLVHDDYRMGNFVWRDGRIVALLDWERAFIGDPMVDVAFSRIEALAGWCQVRGDMAARYSAASGIAIDEARVAYYTILENLKATLVGLTGLKAFADGRTSDLRLVQIGRGGHQAIPLLADAAGVGR